MAIKKIDNFVPRSELLFLTRRNWPVADVTLLDRDNQNCLIEGEWVRKSNGKAVRASTIGSVGNPATLPSVPNFTERGRTDSISMPEPGIDVIEGGTDSQWDTTVYDAAVTVGSGAPITFEGQPLKVATVQLTGPQGTRNYSGLVGHGGSGDSSPIVAYVRTLPSNGVMGITLGGRR